MTPHVIRVAFDSGWSDGDPGPGRVRFDAPSLKSSRWLYISACDQLGVPLDDIIPSWGIGDVLVTERGSCRIVAWVIGPVRHGGSYYKAPISVRSVEGSFAAHDGLALTRYPDEAAADSGQNLVAPAPVAPVAPQSLALADLPPSLPAIPPIAPVALEPDGELLALRQENAALVQMLRELAADPTPIEMVRND